MKRIWNWLKNLIVTLHPAWISEYTYGTMQCESHVSSDLGFTLYTETEDGDFATQQPLQLRYRGLVFTNGCTTTPQHQLATSTLQRTSLANPTEHPQKVLTQTCPNTGLLKRFYTVQISGQSFGIIQIVDLNPKDFPKTNSQQDVYSEK